MPGEHNLRNALAATACALAAGRAADRHPHRASKSFQAAKGRSHAAAPCGWKGADALTLVDDSYNANPDSVRAAIDLLATLPAPQLAACSATWARSATQGPAFHAEVGAHAQARAASTHIWLRRRAPCLHALAAAYGHLGRRRPPL